MLFGHRNFVISVNRAEEDGMLLTMSGEVPVKRGELIGCDLEGNSFPISDSRFNEMYVPVQRVKEKNEDFANAYARQIAEYNNIDMNQEEDNDYITKTLEMSKNKPF